MKSVFKHGVLLVVSALLILVIVAAPDYKLSPRFREAAIHYKNAAFSFENEDPFSEQDKNRAYSDMEATKKSEGDELLFLLSRDWAMLVILSRASGGPEFMKERQLSPVNFMFTCNREFAAALEKREMTPDDLTKNQCRSWRIEIDKAHDKALAERFPSLKPPSTQPNTK